MKLRRWIGSLESDQVLTVHTGFQVVTLEGVGRRKTTKALLPGEKIPFVTAIPSALYRRNLKTLLATCDQEDCHVYFLSRDNTRALFASNKELQTSLDFAEVEKLPFEMLPHKQI